MMIESEKKSDCYSEGERATMLRYQGFKQRLLQPLLRLLVRCGITPDHITLISLIGGLAFCPFYLMNDVAWALPVAFALLAFHLIVDGIDGPLARHTQTASAAGSFTDTMADQLVVAATTITFMLAGQIPGLPGFGIAAGGTFLFLYTIVVVFAMVRNTLGVPYRFVLRPRNGVYLWMLLAVIFPDSALPRMTDPALWLGNLYLGIMTLTGYVAIRKAMLESNV